MGKFKTPLSFDELLSGKHDPLGLLSNVQPVKPKNKTVLVAEKNFLEINEFFSRNKRIPSFSSTDIYEKQLAFRLSTYQQKPELRQQVKALDCYGLLVPKQLEVEKSTENNCDRVLGSLEEIFAAQGKKLLSGIDSSIMHIEHVTSVDPNAKNWPEEIASRKRCEDFYNFEKMFHDMQRDILNKVVKVERFKNETQMDVGQFFILSGLLCYIDCVLEESREESRRNNPRFRVIFENGVETNILKFSFSRALYKDTTGRRIIPDPSSVLRGINGVTPQDKATGCVYILASETKAPALTTLKMAGKLVKIGCSTQTVEERTKNAETDPTYLEAPVRILASLDCYNLNPKRFENLVHAFLVKQRVNMTLISSKGKPYVPKEWYAVDLDTAIAVAEHIIKGDILNYRMDNTTGKIKKVK